MEGRAARRFRWGRKSTRQAQRRGRHRSDRERIRRGLRRLPQGIRPQLRFHVRRPGLGDDYARLPLFARGDFRVRRRTERGDHARAAGAPEAPEMAVASFAAAPRWYLKHKIAPAAEPGLCSIGISKLREASQQTTTTSDASTSDAKGATSSSNADATNNGDATNASDTSTRPRR